MSINKLLNKTNDIIKIKYFTARLASRPHDRYAPERQDTYLRALKTDPIIEILYGHYLTHSVAMPMASNPKQKVKVVKSEEKGSDVNMALHILNDAWKNSYDCAVVASNDSDLAGALHLVKQDHGKTIGLVTPGHHNIRRTSRELAKHADFIKRIRKGILATSQLPETIPNSNITVPKRWLKKERIPSLDTAETTIL